MASSRIGKFQGPLFFSCLRDKAISSLGGSSCNNLNKIKNLQILRTLSYLKTRVLPLPRNISEILSIEIGNFRPERKCNIISLTSHEKYVAENIQRSLYAFKLNSFTNYSQKRDLITDVILMSTKNYSTDQASSNVIKNSKETEITKKEQPRDLLTKQDRFKIVLRDYGKTVIAFHITISLISLGGFYAAVSSGVDITKMVNILGENSSEMMKSIMVNSSTFAIAYAIHKLFAPIRITITLSIVPILVRYLRKKGILKHPDMVEKLKERRLKASESE